MLFLYRHGGQVEVVCKNGHGRPLANQLFPLHFYVANKEEKGVSITHKWTKIVQGIFTVENHAKKKSLLDVAYLQKGVQRPAHWDK